MYHINWTYFCTFIIIIIVIISFQFLKEAWNHFLSFWYWGLKVLESKYIPIPIPIQIHFICRSSGDECVIFYFIHFDGRDKWSLFLSHDLESLGTLITSGKKRWKAAALVSPAQPNPAKVCWVSTSLNQFSWGWPRSLQSWMARNTVLYLFGVVWCSCPP